jgi:hypothetical protein
MVHGLLFRSTPRRWERNRPPVWGKRVRRERVCETTKSAKEWMSLAVRGIYGVCLEATRRLALLPQACRQSLPLHSAGPSSVETPELVVCARPGPELL